MIKIVNNKYVDALLKLMLVTAIIHMLILIPYAIINGKMILTNYFNILDADLLFPNIIYGLWSQILSGVIVVAIYLTFLFKPHRKA
ncbi:MAG: hypothetical protein KKG59_05900 [Nanoarchaeota archaeon]|nr:hypothetical protein [Nanoarchaeota archaeon]